MNRITDAEVGDGTLKRMQKVRSLLKNKKFLAIAALVVAPAIVAVLLLAKQDKPVVQKTEPTITYSTDAPDESKKNADNYNWQGAATEPKKIVIDKLGVNAFVQRAGIDQNKRMAVPNNLHLAAWWADSAKPGQPGYSVIAAHVSGKTMPGVFKELGKLTAGDQLSIELGNGQVKRYEVFKTMKVKESESAAQLYTQDPSVKSQLNLITCGGKFDNAKGVYEDRVIVWTKLL